MTTSEEQVQAEADLAKQLLAANSAERQTMYGTVYDQIYTMHLSREPKALDFGASPRFVPFLIKLTQPGQSVFEIGCGAGLMAIELARVGRKVTGVDVSEVILEKARARAGDMAGVRFERVSGVRLPYPDQVFDCAYSIEVVEHLHERDASVHLAEVRRVLRPGGAYFFLTPTRLESVGASERFGVHLDVDADVHLKEWTHTELAPVLAQAGFSRVRVPIRVHRALGLPWMPASLAAVGERIPSPLVHRLMGLGHIAAVAIR